MSFHLIPVYVISHINLELHDSMTKLHKNLQYQEADDIFWSYGPLINLVFINPVNLICVDSQQLLVGFH